MADGKHNKKHNKKHNEKHKCYFCKKVKQVFPQ